MIVIKVHDIIHEDVKYNAGRVEDYIENGMVSSDGVESVRIAAGGTNSPLFIRVDSQALTLDSIERIARSAVRLFANCVDGIDVDKVIQSDNIMIKG